MMLDAASVDALLLAVARQDATAFRSLYDMTSGRLMAVAVRICRDHRVAEEVLQDVYVNVWNRAATFDPQLGSGPAWLVVMTRNRAIDHLRRNRREAPASTGAEVAELDNLPAMTPGPDQSGDLRSLLACLQKLDPQHARAVLLAYYNGLSRSELARLFDIPENTAKTWLRRSLLTLRHCMGER
jgi:RNA polymerase sigma-70 factor (ECF subfamily)